MQLAVKDIEAVETHLGLHNRCIAYTHTVRQYRAVARYTRGVVELLFLRTTTTRSHFYIVSISTVSSYVFVER